MDFTMSRSMFSVSHSCRSESMAESWLWQCPGDLWRDLIRTSFSKVSSRSLVVDDKIAFLQPNFVTGRGGERS